MSPETRPSDNNIKDKQIFPAQREPLQRSQEIRVLKLPASRGITRRCFLGLVGSAALALHILQIHTEYTKDEELRKQVLEDYPNANKFPQQIQEAIERRREHKSASLTTVAIRSFTMSYVGATLILNAIFHSKNPSERE